MKNKVNKSNLVTLLLAFSIAFFIWLYVANTENPIETRAFTDVEVELVNLDKLKSQDLSISSESINKITITVKGRFLELQKFSSKDIRAFIDLENLVLEEGTNRITINIEINNPDLILVNERSTLLLDIEVEKIIHQDFNISFMSFGSLSAEYVLGEGTVTTTSVLCSGTKNDIDSISTVVALVDISGKTDSFTDIVEIKAFNSNNSELKGIVFDKKEIEVQVPIFLKKDIPIIVNITNQVTQDYELINIEPEYNSVVVYGEKSIIENLNTISTEPLDLSRRYSDFEKFLDLNFPDGVKPINDELNSIYVAFQITKKD